MKLTQLSLIPLAALLGTGQLLAQETAPSAPAPAAPAAPAAPPAPPAPPTPPTPPPGAPAVPGLPGVPAEAAAAPSAIPDAKLRKSYALGLFMVSQMKRGVTEGTTISADEVVAGVNAIMGGDHSVDYGRGISSGLFLKQTELEYDKDMLLQAMREALAGETSKLNENEMRAEMMGMQQEVAGRQKAKAEAQAEKNLAAANAFLEKNKEVAGIITTPTGLQYKMLKEGSGEAPKPDQLVEVHMSMSLVEGKEVEKSSPDKPRTMSQNVNKGFGEAVKLLKPGGQIQFWVPPALGYATSPRPGIPANSVLAYTVELVGVKDAPATQPAQGATLAPQVMPAPPPGAEKKPITATTPPISVEIPPKPQDGSPQPPPKIEQVKPEDMPKEK